MAEFFGEKVSLLTGAFILLSMASGTSSALPDTKVDQELILTQKEKFAFDKFKAAVYPNITDFWKDYIAPDLFLLRFLRSKNLNVNTAIRDMFEYLRFLEENRIDKLFDEDFSDLTPDFPYGLTRDRNLRPVALLSTAEGWNVRQVVIQGKTARVIRYTYSFAFEMLRSVIDTTKQYPNVTQGIVIFNLEGFNVFQHSCAACISNYLRLLTIYERYIPGFVKEVIIINSPQAFLVLLEMLRPVLSPYTRKSLRVFGTNENQWKPYLYARIDPNNLPWDYGGNQLH